MFGAGAQIIGLQFLKLDLRLVKNPSRSFKPVKSAGILWQIWASSSFGASLAHDGSWSKHTKPSIGFSSVRSAEEPDFLLVKRSGFAIGERHLPIESIIASRSTDVMVEPQ
ncbi:hypothetical protein Tco_0761683 [Tanacetum coccineum]